MAPNLHANASSAIRQVQTSTYPSIVAGSFGEGLRVLCDHLRVQAERIACLLESVEQTLSRRETKARSFSWYWVQLLRLR